ncbi:MAG TPA: serine hydrolase [Asticcacaulis sp.]|nr:serine hydrolase [Asticcacaulis sp.]
MKKAILSPGLLCALALASPVFAAPAPAAPDVKKMDALVQSYVDSGQFMGAVLVVQDGKVLLDKGYGYANLEWQTPMTADAKFRIGSMTKQFTAVSILLLEERGKLSTDDLISKYLPGLPAAWDKITIKNLLTHTSGIPNYTASPEIMTVMRQSQTPNQIVALVRDKPLDFPTDSQYAYSNTNYVLLGMIVEKASGQPYARFLQDNIFTPLHMTDTGYDSNSRLLPHRALGYQPGRAGLENAPFVDMSTPFSAGALYSTTHDLRLWEEALFGGKVLQPASLTKMTTPYKNDYGFGLINRVDGAGRRIIEHGGAINGFNSEMAWFPDEKGMIIVLDNIAGNASNSIRSDLEGIVHGSEVPLQVVHKEVAVKPEILASYVGTYELAPTFSIVVTLEDGRLVTQATNQPKVPIFAESETTFFAKVVNAQITFVKGPDGKVTSLILHQNGRDITGVRK